MMSTHIMLNRLFILNNAVSGNKLHTYIMLFQSVLSYAFKILTSRNLDQLEPFTVFESTINH